MFKAVVIAASLASAYATGSDQMLRGNDDASAPTDGTPPTDDQLHQMSEWMEGMTKEDAPAVEFPHHARKPCSDFLEGSHCVKHYGCVWSKHADMCFVK